jgi:serine/threonine-protein kinase
MLTKPKVLLGAAALAGVLIAAPPLRAQEGNKAAAEALFSAGRELMAAGKFNEACSKFEGSQKLDAGLGTLLYLADCYERANRLASAWATFKEAESIAMGRSDQSRAEVAKDRYSKIEPRLTRVVVKVADGNDAGTVVKHNGQVVPRESWGVALPVDAGDQTLEASSPGHKTWTATVRVEGEGVNVPIDVPLLEVDNAPKPAEAMATTAPAEPVPSADKGAQGSSGSTQRTIGLVVGGVGVVGIVVGTIFGLKAKSKNDDSKGFCKPDNPNDCSAQGVNLRDQALNAAKVSTVGMVVGGVALAGGIVLFITAPSDKPTMATGPSLRIAGGTDGSARLTLGGSF